MFTLRTSVPKEHQRPFAAETRFREGESWERGGRDQHEHGLSINRYQSHTVDFVESMGDIGERAGVGAAQKRLLGLPAGLDPFFVECAIVSPDQRAEIQKRSESAPRQPAASASRGKCRRTIAAAANTNT